MGYKFIKTIAGFLYKLSEQFQYRSLYSVIVRCVDSTWDQMTQQSFCPKSVIFIR